MLEAWWRPRRDRKRSAGVLRSELELNRIQLSQIQEQVLVTKPEPTRLVGYRLSRIGLTSVTPLLSELPTALAGDLIRLYDFFDQIDEAYEYVQTSSAELSKMSDRATLRGVQLRKLSIGAGDRLAELVKNSRPLCDPVIEALAQEENRGRSK